MKNVSEKFKQLVRKLNYNQICLFDIDASRIKNWSLENIPKITNQLEELGWNLDKDETWEETVFVNNTVSWYNKRISLYITSSYLDFKLASSVIDSIEFKKLRKDFKLDYHTIVLVDPIMFLTEEDLDIIYTSFDNFSTKKDYGYIDLSHYDDKEQLEEDYISEWGWLEAEAVNGEYVQWDEAEVNTIYTNDYYR